MAIADAAYAKLIEALVDEDEEIGTMFLEEQEIGPEEI